MQPSDSHETAQENVGRPTLSLWLHPPSSPGLSRSWNLPRLDRDAFVGSFTGLPAHAQNIFGGSLGVRDLFDGSMVAASFACALFAKQIGPFFDKKPIYAISSLLLVLSTVLVFSTRFFPESSLFLRVVCRRSRRRRNSLSYPALERTVGCLNPLRVATYYSLSIVVGAIVVYIWHGFMFPWLFVMTAFAAARLHSLRIRKFPSAAFGGAAAKYKSSSFHPLESNYLDVYLRFCLRASGKHHVFGLLRPPFGAGHACCRGGCILRRCRAGQTFRLRHDLQASTPLYRCRLVAHSRFQHPKRASQQLLRLSGLHCAVHTRHGHHRKPMLSLWSICHSAFRNRARRAANFHDCRARSKRPGAPSRKQRRSVLSRIDRRCGNGGNF